MTEPSDIIDFHPRDHVRRRPFMYFGGTDSRALHQLVYEVVDEAVGEALLGKCDRITVTLQKHNSVSISDNGPGISVKLEERTGLTVLEIIMQLIARKYDRDTGKHTDGSTGVGVGAVNAVSKQFLVEVRRDGYVWQQIYSEGKPTSEVVQVRPLNGGEATGTTITFAPDFSIMEPNRFSYHALARRFRELAYLVPGLTLTLKDEREQPEGDEVSFHYPNGLVDFLSSLNRDYTPVHQPVLIREAVDMMGRGGQRYTIDVEAAFQYVQQPASIILSYGNLLETPAGGTHVVGFLRGIALLVNILIQEKIASDVTSNTLDEASFVPGLTAIISIKQQHVAFESANTMRLVNPDAEEGVLKATASAMHRFSEEHPAEMQGLVDHLLARKQERDQRRFGA